MSDKEIDILLERFDQTEPNLQRRIIAAIMAKAALFDDLRRALSDFLICQGRMLSRWAEDDKATKTELWLDLHNCEHFGRKVLDRANKIAEATK